MTLVEIIEFTRSDKPGSLIIRGAIWLIGVLIIAAGVDQNKNESKLKVDAGWFFMFLFTIGILSYVIFGFVPTF